MCGSIAVVQIMSVENRKNITRKNFAKEKRRLCGGARFLEQIVGGLFAF
jgi:hypothetical protein